MLTGHLGKAAFCYEELVLSGPSIFSHHVALAEVYAAMGGAESLRLARKHYAQSMELHQGDDNLRSLYGMCSVSIPSCTQRICFIHASCSFSVYGHQIVVYRQTLVAVVKGWAHTLLYHTPDMPCIGTLYP